MAWLTGADEIEPVPRGGSPSCLRPSFGNPHPLGEFNTTCEPEMMPARIRTRCDKTGLLSPPSFQPQICRQRSAFYSSTEPSDWKEVFPPKQACGRSMSHRPGQGLVPWDSGLQASGAGAAIPLLFEDRRGTLTRKVLLGSLLGPCHWWHPTPTTVVSLSRNSATARVTGYQPRGSFTSS